MAQVISATTRFFHGEGKRAEFLAKAQMLLAQSRDHFTAGEVDLALEYAYQAALRVAGARIAESPVSRRKRKPSDAWGQLRLVDGEGIRQAEIFERYSRFRSRVSSGIELDPSPARVAEVMERAAVFHGEVEFGFGDAPAAA